jgi:hypothetical protein
VCAGLTESVPMNSLDIRWGMVLEVSFDISIPVPITAWKRRLTAEAKAVCPGFYCGERKKEWKINKSSIPFFLQIFIFGEGPNSKKRKRDIFPWLSPLFILL